MFFRIIIDIAFYIFAMFLILCAGIGLYHFSEWAEENSMKTQSILKYAVWFSIFIHIVFMFDGIPFMPLLVGIISHLFYASSIYAYPYFRFLSIASIGSMVAFLVNHLVWFIYFSEAPFSEEFHTFFGFFVLMVWFVPSGFYLTLCGGTDNQMPGLVNLPKSRNPIINFLIKLAL
mmetsp:Transcript_7729/g.11466  ORF Transcript_7729/g.11466 Transcript_7729/m.11466 type:complete len:175 (+) Transcript_7729:78-602(+)